MNIQKFKYLFFIYLFGLFLQFPYLLGAESDTPKHEAELKISYLMRNITEKGGNVINTINNILPRMNESLKIKIISALVLLDKNPNQAYPVFKRYVSYGQHSQQSDDNSAWLIRAICALSLAQINFKEVLPKIRHLYLNEKDLLTQRALLFALGEMKDDDAVDLIIKKLEITRDELTAIYGIVALGKIGNKKATETLVRYSIGNYFNVTQQAAIKALEKINWVE